MTSLLLPPWIPVADIEWHFVGLTGRNISPLSGAVQTVDRGQRLACTLRFENLSGADRHALSGFVAALRGGAHRALIIDPANRRRGAWPGGELFANPTFAAGTAGWSRPPQDYSTAVSDRVYRATGLGSSGYGAGGVGGTSFPAYQGSIGILPHVPYATRCVASSAGAVSLSVYSLGGLAVSRPIPLAGGYAAQPFVRGAAEVAASTGLSSVVGPAGHTVDVHYLSCARCALVDGGGNLIPRSDEMAAWPQEGLSAVNSNSAAAPDGAMTADVLVENSANSAHGVLSSGSRPNATADLCAFARVRRVSGTRNAVVLATDAGGNGARATVDLGTGAVLAASSFGAATDVRAFSVPLGLGWHYIAVVARMPADAQVVPYVRMASGTTEVYTGNGASSIAVWRAGALVSSVATRGSLTTTVAVASAPQTGTAIHLAGLPPSVTGLALRGDTVEIGGELKRLTASLDSDAAGLGILHIEPAMRVPAAHGEAAIFHEPIFRGVLADDGRLSTRPATFTDATLTFIEA